MKAPDRLAPIIILANQMSSAQLCKFQQVGRNILAEDPADAREGESARTARARRRQSEVEALRAEGRHEEAARAERDP